VSRLHEVAGIKNIIMESLVDVPMPNREPPLEGPNPFKFESLKMTEFLINYSDEGKVKVAFVLGDISKTYVPLQVAHQDYDGKIVYRDIPYASPIFHSDLKVPFDRDQLEAARRRCIEKAWEYWIDPKTPEEFKPN